MDRNKNLLLTEVKEETDKLKSEVESKFLNLSISHGLEQEKMMKLIDDQRNTCLQYFNQTDIVLNRMESAIQDIRTEGSIIEEAYNKLEMSLNDNNKTVVEGMDNFEKSLEKLLVKINQFSGMSRALPQKVVLMQRKLLDMEKKLGEVV